MEYRNQGLPLEDLINEGNLGLIKATKRFDETKGFKFISYAVWWIKKSILQSLAEQTRTVRLPSNQITTISQIGKAYNSLEEIGEKFHMAREQVRQIKEKAIIRLRHKSRSRHLRQFIDL